MGEKFAAEAEPMSRPESANEFPLASRMVWIAGLDWRHSARFLASRWPLGEALASKKWAPLASLCHFLAHFWPSCESVRPLGALNWALDSEWADVELKLGVGDGWRLAALFGQSNASWPNNAPC